MESFVAELRKIPPVTRFLCASSLVVTLPVLMKAVSAYHILFVKELVLQKFQIWRLWSSFFLGSGGINYIFEFAMLYRTTNELESGPYARRSADLAWQLIAAGLSIIVISTPLPSSYLFSRPLLVSLTYLSTALAPPGAQTSLMGLLTLPAKYLPYLMIGMDLLMGGPAAAAQAVAGAVVGHFWWWGVWGQEGRGGGVLEAWGSAPGWLRGLVGESADAGRGVPTAGAGAGAMGGGVHVIPPRRAAAATAGPAGSTGGGYNWGSSGQRLGS